MNKIRLCICLATLALAATSCKKYLDAKSNKDLVVPTQVADLQGLLDNYRYMNYSGSEAGEIAADNYFLTQQNYDGLSRQTSRDAYLWKPGIFEGYTPSDWQNEYNTIYQSNVVLETLPNISRNAKNESEWENCMGQALVFRAKSLFEIAQIWAKGYDTSSAETDLGIPLKLTSNFNETTFRSTLKETYGQVINDLQKALPLLPSSQKFVFRPSKPSAYALLSRVYLMMHNYQECKKYADSCLLMSNTLLDFNTLDSTQSYPFASIQYSNPEDLMYSRCNITNFNLVFVCGRVDTSIYNSYSDDDLRKVIFYKTSEDGYKYFRGSMTGTYANYNGLSIDEVYLNRAEAEARIGDKNNALHDLNVLLKTRWKSGSFVEYQAQNNVDALRIILNERRKELVFRMLRFSDIKRLNIEGENIVIKRFINGQIYTLPAGDKKYALPIPNSAIEASGIQQN